MLKDVDGWLGWEDVLRRMAHTTPERETTLRGLLKFQFGVADADSVANPLAAAARAAGYQDEYDLALSMLINQGAARRKQEEEIRRERRNTNRQKRRVEKPVAETEEDAKIPDDELLLVLASMLEDAPAGVRGPAWYRTLLVAFEELGGKMSMTRDGFYARVQKLVHGGKVKTTQAKMPTKLYGRDVLMNVTLYSLPVEGAAH